jgi:hypothetical protein
MPGPVLVQAGRRGVGAEAAVEAREPWSILRRDWDRGLADGDCCPADGDRCPADGDRCLAAALPGGQATCCPGPGGRGGWAAAGGGGCLDGAGPATT